MNNNPQLQLGVSHQTPEKLTPERLQFLQRMGVEKIEIRIASSKSSYEEIMKIKERVIAAGIKVHEIMLADIYSCRRIALGLPGREEDIKKFKQFIKDLGKAEIDTTTYAWHTGGAYSTGETKTRGCQTRLFELSKTRDLPRAYERDYSLEEVWQNYETFITEILPIAEDNKVRLQLHPNDPPVDHQGVPRLFSSRLAFRRAMEISNYSPYSGILFCVGCFAEMFGPNNRGEDIIGAIHEFGSRGNIFQVHFRNISSPMPDFYETFPDNGYLNMFKIMDTLFKVGYRGMIVPDHVPKVELEEEKPLIGEAYILGYIKALIQEVGVKNE